MEQPVLDPPDIQAQNELRIRLEDASSKLRAVDDGLAAQSIARSRVFSQQGEDTEDNRQRGELLAQIADAVIAVDNGDFVIYLNNPAERLFGLPASEAVGRPVAEVFSTRWRHSDDEASASVALREQGEWRGESLLVRHDGGTVSVESSIAVTRDKYGQENGRVAVIRDISERKAAQEALTRSDNRFRVALVNSPITVFEQDLDLRFTSVFNAKLALDDNLILGKNDFEILDLGVAKRLTDIKRRALATGKLVREEVAVNLPGQPLSYFELSVEPRRSSENQFDGIICTSFDITERKLAEAALLSSEARLIQVLDRSPAGIVQTDASGQIILVNDRWCEMLGYSKSEMLGMSVIELTHPSSVATTVEDVGRLAKGGPDFQIEKNYLRKDGVVLRCNSNVAGLRDAQGNYQGLLAVVFDITERLEAEEQLRESDRQHQFLLELSDRLHSAADATAAMSAAAKLFAQYCGLPVAQYLIIGPDGDHFDVAGRYSAGWLPAALRHSGRLSDHGPGWGPQFRNGEAVFSEDHDNRTEADADASQALGIRSGSAVPLIRDGRLVALFTTASPGPHRWTSADKALQHEVAQRTWAAVERARAEAALHVAHDTFRHLVDRSPFGIYAVDADFRLVQVSEGAQKVFENVRPLLGRDFAEVLGIIWPEPFATEAIAFFRHTLTTGEPYHAPNSVETRADSAAIETYDWKIERVILPDGRPGVVCHFYDLTEMQRQQDHIKLLMGEVNHRSKNMLGLIPAIARQTVAKRPEDFLESFGQRVRALSASQDLLVKSEWKAVQLSELVSAQLAHFGNEHDMRITIEGPPVKITASASQSLGMAIHELATNAAKYGALSNESGRVAICWTMQADAAGQAQFAMSWVESGGPVVTKPARQGFGSTMIDGMLKMSLDCDAEVDFPPTGLIWRINCSASGVIESYMPAIPRSSGTATANEPVQVAGRRVLVVEDEALIAMDLSEMLSEAGYVVIGPANSVAQALALIKQFGCDAAVLDTNLGEETSEPVARELVRSGTPYIATSGYSREQQPEFMQAAPLLGKPVRPERLIAELARCLDEK